MRSLAEQYEEKLYYEVAETPQQRRLEESNGIEFRHEQPLSLSQASRGVRNLGLALQLRNFLCVRHTFPFEKFRSQLVTANY